MPKQGWADVGCPSLFNFGLRRSRPTLSQALLSMISNSDDNLVQNFLGKQLNGQNGPDVKATVVQYSKVKPSDIKVIGMEDIHKAKYSTYFSMDQVGFHIDASNLISHWLQEMDSESAHVIRWKHQFENPNQTWLKLKPEFQPKLVNSYTEVFWPRNELQEPIRNENGMTESETLCDIFSNLNINSTVSLDKMKKIYFDESNWSRAEAGFQNAF